MIDLHAHVLPGVDDGPRDVEGSIALLRAAADDGAEVVCATPHVGHDFSVARPAELGRRCADLQALTGDAPALVPAAEVTLGWAVEADELDLRLATYGQRGTDLLVETPYAGLSTRFEELLFAVAIRGVRVLLAHPERNPTFQRDPERLAALARRGILLQVTASSLLGRRRSRRRRLAAALVEEGLAHVIASDAHAADGSRAPGLRAAVAAAGRLAGGRASWMVTDAPAAILDGAPLPGPPRAGKA